MHVLSLSVMVTLAVDLLKRTAESLVKSIKPNCSCGSSTMRSSSMVKFLQSSMGELVNVRWTVVTAKSIGAANRRGWRVITSMVDVTSIYQGTLTESIQENFTNFCSYFVGIVALHYLPSICKLQKCFSPV